MSDPHLIVRGMFDPWGLLRSLVHVTISWGIMPDGSPGRTNGTDIIWLDRRLHQAERRCTVTHELIHIELGHDGCQQAAVEMKVRAETARRLIPIEALCKHLAWARSIQELAEELWVTPEVAQDRLRTLRPDEQNQLKGVEPQPH